MGRRASKLAAMDEPIRWGVVAPTFDQFGLGIPPPVVAAARRAEQLGFDAVWVGDHLVCPAPGLDSLGSLSAAAAVTSHVELGLSVLQLGLRHLVWTAKQLTTIDALAPGRLRLGVGVGGEFTDEFVAAGVSRSSRGRRLDEMLGVLPALLPGEPVHHRGDHVAVQAPELRPALRALPPLSVGGRSEAALARTARYGDQWMAMWLDPQTMRDRADRLEELAADQHRPVPSVAMLVLVNVNDDIEAARREVAASLDGMYDLPLRVVDRWTGYGSAEDVAKLLIDYRDVGVTEFILLPAAPDPVAQLDRLVAVRRLVDG
jgi:alkanesulfonate monooxygenase SsuD/methylene tetrahydromethanopterin reductase-like flavin-dependent oxidoreductase (luciferase family)